MARRDRSERPARPDRSQDPGFGGSLGELLRAQGLISAEAPAAPADAVPQPQVVRAPEALGRVLLQIERRGRGGKTVTRLSGALGPEPDRAELARQIARALGAGATLEDDSIWVQGDQRDRLRPWLVARGAEVRG